MPANYAGDGTTFPLTVPVIADGERLSEANLGPGFRKSADRSAYLKRVLPSVTTWSTNLGAPFFAYANSGVVETTATAGGKVNVAGCVAGDVLVCSAFMLVNRTGDEADSFEIWLDAIDDVTGTPGTQTHLAGAHYDATDGIPSDQLTRAYPVTLSGSWTVVAPGTTRITIALKSTEITGGDDLELWPGLNISVIRFPA